jgi:hypothetical protein
MIIVRFILEKLELINPEYVSSIFLLSFDKLIYCFQAYPYCSVFIGPPHIVVIQEGKVGCMADLTVLLYCLRIRLLQDPYVS